MSYVALAVGIAGVAVSAYGTVKSTNNQKLAGEYGKALSTLSYQDQQILNEKMLRASNQNERLSILANAVSGIKAAQAAQASKNRNVNTILILAAGTSLVVAAYLIKKT